MKANWRVTNSQSLSRLASYGTYNIGSYNSFGSYGTHNTFGTVGTCGSQMWHKIGLAVPLAMEESAQVPLI